MAKINISVPDGLLEEVDERARSAGLTRSGFIQEATAHYLADLDAEVEADARAERIGRAIAKMRKVAEHMPPGTDGTAIIRRFRDAPEPWMNPKDADR